MLHENIHAQDLYCVNNIMWDNYDIFSRSTSYIVDKVEDSFMVLKSKETYLHMSHHDYMSCKKIVIHYFSLLSIIAYY